MRIHIPKNLLLALASLLIGIFLVIICAEAVFFISHGDWYGNLGLHVRQKELPSITKDRNLLSGYDRSLLDAVPGNDSALREYVRLINFKKKDGVYRILCIGGSTTRSVGLDNSQSYPAYLQRLLDAASPGRFEVFNLGMHFGTTWDFLERFHKASADANFGWRDLEADLVILAPVWNDLRLQTMGVGYDEKMCVIGNLKWKELLDYTQKNLSSRCALGYYIYKALAIIHERSIARYYIQNLDSVMAKLEPAKADFRNRIIKIIDLWRKEKARLYLVVFPSLIEEGWPASLIKKLLKLNYPESAYFEHSLYPLIQKSDREVIGSIATEYKVTFYDFSGTAKGLPVPQKVKLFVDAVHLGPQINYFIAEDLAQGVLNDSGIKKREK